MENQHDQGFYPKFLLFTIASVCFLILVGGIVRSTGSGMGCPDWPKCFGSWIPPTSPDQLPTDYEQVYSVKRQSKNVQLAKYVEIFGFNDLAEQLRSDEDILLETSFNPVKTWIEYLNRLVGVAIGLFVFLNVVIAILSPEQKRFRNLAVSIFLLTGFQGWVGSVVVSTNLLPGTITFHMILALVILGLLIYNYWQTKRLTTQKIKHPEKLEGAYQILTITFVLFSVQVILGTQVREAVDQIAISTNGIGRELWVSSLKTEFYFHRSFSIVVLGMHAWFVYLFFKYQIFDARKKLIFVLIASIGLSVLTGIMLSYFGLPPYLQPLHLFLATIIFGIDLYLILELGQLRRGIKTVKL